ncbi:H-NS family nucleoid-associated regulatory protein [Alkanindiges sp. WGS2144]|uniref:H-NS histone family protein n=1 Tax=Alkanindiges sp. WGS2144 TaxID=3366808 RepID=UPI003753B415
MQPDISNLTVAELKKLTDKAEALIEAKKEQELDAAYDKIKQIAAEAGVSLEELIARGSKSGKAGTRKPVAPRYRNPENHNETWTGRGKQPRWLVAKIADGARLESFLIQA